MQNTIYGNRVSLGERLGDIVARTRSFPHEICKEAPRIRVGNMRSLAAGLIAIFLFSSPCVALMHTRHATKSFASTPLISRISATPIPYSIPSAPHCLSSSTPTCLQLSSNNKDPQTSTSNDNSETKEPTAFERVAQQGLAGVLAIAVAEAIFWALGVPLASLWSLYTTGECLYQYHKQLYHKQLYQYEEYQYIP